MSAYHCLPGPLDFRSYFQLQLQIDRVRLQHAWVIGQGVTLAHTTGKLDRAWADAVARTPEEAGELHWRINQERKSTDR